MLARTITGDMLRKLINNGTYKDKEDMQVKLDIFLMGNRITEEEYQELTELLDQKEAEKEAAKEEEEVTE